MENLQPRRDAADIALEKYYSAPKDTSPEELAGLRQNVWNAAQDVVQAAQGDKNPTFWDWIAGELGISEITFWIT